jgi:hypothetical protein
LAALAAAVKKGEPWAVRRVLDRVYPTPPPTGKGQGDADLPADLDVSGAMAAIAPPLGPKQKSLRDQVEDEVLAREPEYTRATRLLAAGFHGDDDLARAVEAEMKKRGVRG